ncbi:hypothetical protein FisN_1Lh678 [Fistulifera solaris]|uniref:Uncharacterized protein n=1 Tax=Fistulifera solaris TaxID=1519565 RepID=A0A1Z5K0N2_FISSO|nr:hypothetical protein FisN_1Lh678 [Fistulifera solaris]|eukprot:GAX19863.1 hypothetical protein FisN_1Lh678 [Fistulifera solaris]
MKSFLALVLAASAFLIVSTLADEDIGLCCLCDNCKPVVRGRESLKVDDKGKTCNDLYMELADPTNESKMGNSVCLNQIHQFRSHCCDATHIPIEIVQAPTPAPNFGMEQGTEPICNICRDGSYPTIPFAKIVTFDRFIKGEKTCDELYRMGRTGNIPDQICNPLVNYAKRPCGCTSNQALRAPTPSPTAKPVTRPSTSPTSDPSMTPSNNLEPSTSPSTRPSLAPAKAPSDIDDSWKESTWWTMIMNRMSRFYNREQRQLRGKYELN